MMTIFAPILAAVLLAQPPADRTVTGEVVDGRGKPVADAQVVLYAPPTLYGEERQTEVQTRTDSEGKFRLTVPPLGRFMMTGVNLLAYRPGFAITAHAYLQPPYRLVLEEPRLRTIRVEGPGGRPVPGARVAIGAVNIFGKVATRVPASLADQIATSTGPDGTATLSALAPRDQLMAVRLTADTIGTQDIVLVEQPRLGSEQPVIAIKLQPSSHLAGRIVDHQGRPVASQLVEVWSRGNTSRQAPSIVALENGPLRSNSDGSFRTPDNLMAGSSYRIALRAPDHEPVLSDWVTIGTSPRTLPDMVLQRLRTLHGRVVDRQGKPVAAALVFQSGDGPRRTTIQTDAGGRFALAGFRQGPVFLFARAPGFRFLGQLSNPAGNDVTIELTRESERPLRKMTMLPDPIPSAESRKLAQRLAEPHWAAIATEVNDRPKYTVLRMLAQVDPARLLQRMQTIKFPEPESKLRLHEEIVSALAATDFEEAAAVAESLAEPVARASALVQLADKLPIRERRRKLMLLDRALIHARVANEPSDRLLQLGEVAERWYELGEVEKAKALFVEGGQIAAQFTNKTDFSRGLFAGRLALVDVPGALAIVKDFDGTRQQGWVLGGLAFRLVVQDPAEAERVWNRTQGKPGPVSTDPTLSWKMGTVDPARARRILEGMARIERKPELFLFLALGAKARDPSLAHSAFETGLRGLDRLMQSEPEQYQHIAGTLLPVVERIDPAFVAEVFWRDVASRLPEGNPRALQEYSLFTLISRLAWYDRDAAAVLFEPSRARIDHSSGDQLTDWSRAFVAWSHFDPRAAVDRLEKLPFDPKGLDNVSQARLAVAGSLSQTHEERWRTVWRNWDIIFGGTKRDF